MSPHVPTTTTSSSSASSTFAFPTFTSPLNSLLGGSSINSLASVTTTMPLQQQPLEKKRGRAHDDFSHARKKIASELMAFEFESLSLNNAVGSAVQDDSNGSSSDSVESHPRLHPPVQQQNPQEHQQQLDQERIGQYPRATLLQQQPTQGSSLYEQRQQRQWQYQQQRGRAKSSPAGPSHIVSEQRGSVAVAGAGLGSGQGQGQAQGASSSSSSSYNDNATYLISMGPPSPLLSSSLSPPATTAVTTMTAPVGAVCLRPTPLQGHRFTLDSAATTPSSSSSFSPLSPPISPLPHSSPSTASTTATAATTMDMEDEGMDDTSNGLSYFTMTHVVGQEASYSSSFAASSSSPAQAATSSSSSSSSTPNVKVLNLRQRKWNSISKEWQEWQEVQATHTPDLPPSHSLLTQASFSSSSSSPSTRGARPGAAPGATPVPRPATADIHYASPLDQWSGGAHGRDTSSSNKEVQSHSSFTTNGGLGRQRSFQGAGERTRFDQSGGSHGGDNNVQNDPRSAFGARARSFSETNIHPYTQPQPSNQQQQQDPYMPQHQQSQPQSYSPSPFYQMPIPQRNTSSTLTQVESHQQQHQLSQLLPSPTRHHSDHVYPHQMYSPGYGRGLGYGPGEDAGLGLGGDPWERNDDGEAALSGHIFQPQAQQGHPARTRHSHGQSSSSGSGGGSGTRPQHPWMALSMTALDGTMNIHNDRHSRLAPSSSISVMPSLTQSHPIAASSSSSSSSSALTSVSSAAAMVSHGFRHEEAGNTWNQQLLKSQNGHRETFVNGGVTTQRQHGGFGRTSPVQVYGQQLSYHQQFQGGQEDVSMGEENQRPMPSRGSSPAPCLSMVPTVTRPLSISFSHLAGPTMLGNLAEHEHDDDMEL